MFSVARKTLPAFTSLKFSLRGVGLKLNFFVKTPDTVFSAASDQKADYLPLQRKEKEEEREKEKKKRKRRKRKKDEIKEKKKDKEKKGKEEKRRKRRKIKGKKR